MLCMVSCVVLGMLRVCTFLLSACLVCQSRLSDVHSNRNYLGESSDATVTHYHKVSLDTVVMHEMAKPKYQTRLMKGGDTHKIIVLIALC